MAAQSPTQLTQIEPKTNGSLTQTVGLPDPPQPAPRRISQDGKLTNGSGATSPTNSRKADEEPQVLNRFFFKLFFFQL